MTTKRDINKPAKFTHDRKLAIDTFSKIIKSTGDPVLRSMKDIVLSSDEDINAILTSSFTLGTEEGLVSTQQLNADFSKFENHTFFNSAIVNTNVGFDKIINKYPFDGTRADVIMFLESLTGFERYLFNSFPKNTGFLLFSGSLSQSISVYDFTDVTQINQREKGFGKSILDPGEKSFSIETQIFLPKITTVNNHEYIAQKLSGTNHGISLVLSASTSTVTGTIMFAVTSGSHAMVVSGNIEKGKFNHIVATLDRETHDHKLKFFVNTALVDVTGGVGIGQIQFSTSSLVIGDASRTHVFKDSEGNTGTFTRTNTFSGALDDLRIWHATRSIDSQERYRNRNIFAQKDLKLYFRFNEPRHNPNPATIIDSSGNGLHGNLSLSIAQNALVNNAMPVSSALRDTGSFVQPMSLEDPVTSPILYRTHRDVDLFYKRLIASASNYDNQNENLITRLVPQHYFEEGATFEYQTFEPQLDNNDIFLGRIETYTEKLGTSQILASFLYTIAKGLDEIKIFIDQFQNILTVNLDEFDNAPSELIPKVAEFYGLKFSTLFENASFKQFFFNEDITINDELIERTLLELRNDLWKQVFANMPDILKSKGTIHSIKSMIRALGINPDTNFRIREFGGPTISALENSRLERFETSTLLEMSSSTNRGSIRTHYLTASAMDISRYTPHGRVPSDILRTGRFQGLLTSRSFAVEQVIKIPYSISSVTQSLSRMMITGSINHINPFTDVAINLLAFSSSNPAAESSSLKLYVKPHSIEESDRTDKTVVVLSGVNVFDNEKWNIAYGKNLISEQSSSYFLYAAKNVNGDVTRVYSSSMNVRNIGSSQINVFNAFSASVNASGAYIEIGSSSINNNGGFLLTTRSLDNDYSQATYTNFEGKVGHVRFWTKPIHIEEFIEHTKNFKSIGTRDPRTDNSFVTSSEQRLIIDASTDQITKATDSNGAIRIFDFSQNAMHLSGTGFNTSDTVIKNEDFMYSILSPFFDENQNIDKVKIRSFTQKDNIIFHNVDPAPVTEVLAQNISVPDPRFSIDFSIIDALDEDIIKILSTLNSLHNDIGNTENLFAYDYRDLGKLRRDYFNRLTEKINLKSFFDFFVWFDQNIGDFIKQLIPERVSFGGLNFVIESHILERPKFNYNYYNIYLNENARNQTGESSRIYTLNMTSSTNRR